MRLLKMETQYTNLRAKAEPREKIIKWKYLKREECSQIHNLRFHVRTLKTEEQTI
jgi:hypothetical protein